MASTSERDACRQHGGVAEGADAFEHYDGPIRARPPDAGAELCDADTSSQSACANHRSTVEQRPAGPR